MTSTFSTSIPPEVLSYFDAALELPPAERQTWLADLDTTQPHVAHEVRRLLTQLDALDSAGFLRGSPLADENVASAIGSEIARAAGREPDASAPLPEAATLRLHAGDTVGPYRLLREIGHGGMATVWQAERADGQLKRTLALKLPFCDPRLTERFFRERDILAALTHPQIARLYDAGVSERGQPYLALEYVAGTALLEHCDRERLGVRERIEIFLQVLEAVQFAHAQLIIHRDLKPSNILVTAERRVVLLDFGIGKLLGETNAEATQLGRALTPDYASPEQIAGRPLGTASDIYSLGVILYELLTGVRPYRPKRESAAALEESILSATLRRPSQSDPTQEIAAARGLSIRSLVRELRGDLDTIVLEALKKDPLERYQSVTALAQDLRNYLQALPVSARPDSYRYRIGRFMWRHKLPIAAASVTAFALIAGSGIALWQARAATIERDRAVSLAARNAAVTDFMNTVLAYGANADRPVTPRELLARSERLVEMNTEEPPETRAAVMAMIATNYSMTAADNARALDLIDKSRALIERSGDQVLKSQLTCVHAAISMQMGKADAAVAELREELGKLDSEPRTAAECLMTLGQVCAYACSREEQLRYAQEGLRRIRTVHGGTQSIEGQLLAVIANAYGHTDRFAEANAYYGQSLAKLGEIGQRESPLGLVILADWATATNESGRHREAVAMYEEKMRIEARHDPEAAPSRVTLTNYARALQQVGKFDAARRQYARACREGESLDENVMARASCLYSLMKLDLASGALTEAARHFALFDTLVSSHFKPGSELMRMRTHLAGRLALAQGRLIEARDLLTQAMPKVENSDTKNVVLDVAELELADGKPAEAATLARRVLGIGAAKQGGPANLNLAADAWFILGRALLQSGDYAAASEALDTAVSDYDQIVDANHPLLLDARRLLADARQHRGAQATGPSR
jgi:serine/threonine protein kinase